MFYAKKRKKKLCCLQYNVRKMFQIFYCKNRDKLKTKNSPTQINIKWWEACWFLKFYKNKRLTREKERCCLYHTFKWRDYSVEEKLGSNKIKDEKVGDWLERNKHTLDFDGGKAGMSSHLLNWTTTTGLKMVLSGQVP